MSVTGKATATALAYGKSSGKIHTKKDQLITIIVGEGEIEVNDQINIIKKSESYLISQNSEYEIRNNQKEILIYAIIESANSELIR